MSLADPPSILVDPSRSPFSVASKVDLKAHNLVWGSDFETNPRLFSEFLRTYVSRGSVSICLNRDPHVKLTRKEPLEHSGELVKHGPAKQLSWFVAKENPRQTTSVVSAFSLVLPKS